MEIKKVVPILVAALAVGYGISPVDLAPELVLGPVGFVDDAVVLVAAFGVIRKLLSDKGESERPTVE